MTKYLICDLRADWARQPYVTFWCPNNANYTWPLIWAGDYTKEQVDAEAGYYTSYESGRLIRFAVPRKVAEAMAIAPKPGWIVNASGWAVVAGPVILNKGNFRAKLRKAAYIPIGVKP